MVNPFTMYYTTIENVLFWTSFETTWSLCHVLSGTPIGFDTARYVDIDFD